MSEQQAKTVNARISQKHDYEYKWIAKPDFIPNAGELIVYDAEGYSSIDSAGNLVIKPIDGVEYTYNRKYPYTYPRFKVGDGTTKLCELPFTNSEGTGNYSHAEGVVTVAKGTASHAEGGGTLAERSQSHAEGTYTQALGTASHAEGYNTIAHSDASHSEGYKTEAIGRYSHAEGFTSTAEGYVSHAEGYETCAIDRYTHAEGRCTVAKAICSHAEGNLTEASGQSSHAEGEKTRAISKASHAEGFQTTAGCYAMRIEKVVDKEHTHESDFGCLLLKNNPWKIYFPYMQQSTEKAPIQQIFEDMYSDGWSEDEQAMINIPVSDETIYVCNQSVEVNGVTFSIQSDWSINVTGSCSSEEGSTLILRGGEGVFMNLSPETYTVGGGTNNVHVIVRGIRKDTLTEFDWLVSNGGSENEVLTGVIDTEDNKDACYVALRIPYVGEGVVINDVIKPVFYSGSRELTFEDAYKPEDEYSLMYAWGKDRAGKLIAVFDNIVAVSNIWIGVRDEAHGGVITSGNIQGDDNTIHVPDKPNMGDVDIGVATYAQGENNTSRGRHSFVGGEKSISEGPNSFAFGKNVIAQAQSAVAVGRDTIASGEMSHAEGWGTTASGEGSHAEGSYDDDNKQNRVTSSGKASHAEGYATRATKNYAHAEGFYTVAGYTASHAEGYETKVESDSSTGAHAEGYSTRAKGQGAHAEGVETHAGWNGCHAEGQGTVAIDVASHAEGVGTTAKCDAQHVQGKFNIVDEEKKYAHIVGGGTKDEDRKNIHTLDWAGNAWFAGAIAAGPDNIVTCGSCANVYTQAGSKNGYRTIPYAPEGHPYRKVKPKLIMLSAVHNVTDRNNSNYLSIQTYIYDNNANFGIKIYKTPSSNTVGIEFVRNVIWTDETNYPGLIMINYELHSVDKIVTGDNSDYRTSYKILY